MTYPKSFWSKKLALYAEKDWANKPSPFVEDFLAHLPANSKVLEFGADVGQDSAALASAGHVVVATDGTDAFFPHINSLQIPLGSIQTQKLDLLAIFPFADSSFDAVYAHLVLHYFDDSEMQQIVTEISRVLRPGGHIGLLVNSQSDPEYDEELANSQDIIVVNGIKKRFFTTKTLAPFVEDFETLTLDSNGTTPKDVEKGIFNMVQFIGRTRP